ncbi:MAG: GNAT family N-acetyltransferase [Terriglobales bacterium]
MSTSAASLSAQVRRARPEDAVACGMVCWNAFNTVADQHRAPREMPPDPQMAVGLFTMAFSNPKFYCVVAEQNGRIVGSNCLDERGSISGIGPITIDPAVQNSGIGRRLMEAVIARSNERGFLGCRLMQAGYHMRSLSLYTKLGFVERETVVRMQGPAIGKIVPGYSFRKATPADASACNALCFRVHGHDRAGELADAMARGDVTIADEGGRIVGYTTGFSYFGHTVAEYDRDLIALIAQAASFEGTGFMVPVRNHEVFNWCLNHGLRALHLNTLMTIGLYNEPQGAWLPSILH